MTPTRASAHYQEEWREVLHRNVVNADRIAPAELVRTLVERQRVVCATGAQAA